VMEIRIKLRLEPDSPSVLTLLGTHDPNLLPMALRMPVRYAYRSATRAEQLRDTPRRGGTSSAVLGTLPGGDKRIRKPNYRPRQRTDREGEAEAY
jgi:hypothetical protein